MTNLESQSWNEGPRGPGPGLDSASLSAVVLVLENSGLGSKAWEEVIYLQLGLACPLI